MGIVEYLMRLGREHADEDAAALAADALTRHTKADLLPLLVREIEHGQRGTHRSREHEAFRDLFTRQASAPIASSAVSVPSDALSRFRGLFAHVVAIGDGSRVTVKEATRDQWSARRQMLQRNVDGLLDDIAICDQALALLRAHDVDCLGDIGTVDG